MNHRAGIVLALIGIAVLALGFWIWFFSEEPKTPFEKLTATYQKLTIPPDALSVKPSEVRMRNHSANARWEFETGWAWEKYREWTLKQLEGRMRLARESDHEMIFVLTEVGDSYSVKVDKMSVDPLRIRITFVGMAF